MASSTETDPWNPDPSPTFQTATDAKGNREYAEAGLEHGVDQMTLQVEQENVIVIPGAHPGTESGGTLNPKMVLLDEETKRLEVYTTISGQPHV